WRGCEWNHVTASLRIYTLTDLTTFHFDLLGNTALLRVQFPFKYSSQVCLEVGTWSRG
ncbi:unnamed protein product, partial [Allacma fusca]